MSIQGNRKENRAGSILVITVLLLGLAAAPTLHALPAESPSIVESAWSWLGRIWSDWVGEVWLGGEKTAWSGNFEKTTGEAGVILDPNGSN